jgi:integrase
MRQTTFTFLVKPSYRHPYYFRSIVPLDLRGTLGQNQFLLSLQDHNFQSARRTAYFLNVKVKEIYSDIRNGRFMKELTLSAVKEILREHLFDGKRLNEIYAVESFHPSATRTPEHAKKRAAEIRKLIDEKDLYGDRFPIDGLLIEKGYAIDKSSKEYLVLLREYAHVNELLWNHQHDLLSGKEKDSYNLLDQILEEETTNDNPIKQQIERTSKIVNASTVNKVVSMYIRDLKISKRVSEKTIGEYKYRLGTFLELIEPTLGSSLPTEYLMSELTREIVRKFADDLRKLPPNPRKDPRHRELSLKQIVEMGKVDETISATTFNGYIKVVSAFFNWSIVEGYINRNFATGLRIRKSKQAREARDPFTSEELKCIFGKDNFLNAVENSSKGNEVYYIPLIALFSGLRQNEICQLHVNDIRQINDQGISFEFWCFDINEDSDYKRLKSISSRRLVPIHTILIELGLLEYHGRIKKMGYPRLFPKLTYAKRDGYGKYISKWWHDYLVSVNVKTKRNNFHSLRKNFTDVLKQKRVDEALVAQVLGHKGSEGISYNRYAAEYNVGTIVEEVIIEVDFPDIDWKALKRS